MLTLLTSASINDWAVSPVCRVFQAPVTKFLGCWESFSSSPSPPQGHTQPASCLLCLHGYELLRLAVSIPKMLFPMNRFSQLVELSFKLLKPLKWIWQWEEIAVVTEWAVGMLIQWAGINAESGTGLLILKLRQHPPAVLPQFLGRVCRQGKVLTSAPGQQFTPTEPGLWITSFSCSAWKRFALHITTSWESMAGA